jgi:hypothetical protein
VEIASGVTKRLYEGRPGAMNWVFDSNAVIVSETPEAAGPQRRIFFRRVDFDGNVTLLRELPVDEQAGSLAAPIDRSTAIVFRAPRDFRLIRLDGSAAEQSVSPAQPGFVLPLPSISRDKEWVAFRINPSANNATRMNVVELVRTDGSARRTVQLPFFALEQDTLKILPGATDLIVVERPSPGANPGVYTVNVATGSVKRLFEFVPQGRSPDVIASPDGRTLLTLGTEMLTPSVSAMDFSHIE